MNGRQIQEGWTVFLIVPYHVDVPMRCRPWANWIIIALTVLMYPACMSRRGEFTRLGEHLMLHGTGTFGWIGHVLVHADVLHLLGNTLFLWVFGNAVCAKVGNFAFLFIYFGLGLFAAVLAQLADTRPAVGASGAINGVVGIFLVWYPLNGIKCWYVYWFFSLGDSGTIEVSSYWMILLWLAFDILGLALGGGNIGYAAHLAGFGAGFSLALVLLKLGWIEMQRGERSLLQLFSDKS